MTDSSDYTKRANFHRPTDPTELEAEMRRLRAEGLKPRDISVALRLDLGAVLNALRERGFVDEKQ